MKTMPLGPAGRRWLFYWLISPFNSRYTYIPNFIFFKTELLYHRKLHGFTEIYFLLCDSFQKYNILIEKFQAKARAHKTKFSYRNLISTEETQGWPLEQVMVNENNSLEK